MIGQFQRGAGPFGVPALPIQRCSSHCCFLRVVGLFKTLLNKRPHESSFSAVCVHVFNVGGGKLRGRRTARSQDCTSSCRLSRAPSPSSSLSTFTPSGIRRAEIWSFNSLAVGTLVFPPGSAALKIKSQAGGLNSRFSPRTKCSKTWLENEGNGPKTGCRKSIR